MTLKQSVYQIHIRQRRDRGDTIEVATGMKRLASSTPDVSLSRRDYLFDRPHEATNFDLSLGAPVRIPAGHFRGAAGLFHGCVVEQPRAEVHRIGIATPSQVRERTMKIARGELRPGPEDPKVWVPSLAALGRIMSEENQNLLNVIRVRGPKSVSELADLLGRAASNVLRTLRSLEKYGLVTLQPGDDPRMLRPTVAYKHLEVTLTMQGEEVSVPVARRDQPGELRFPRAVADPKVAAAVG